MKKTIAIAGLGWLGKPLLQRLKMLGYLVKGSVTTTESAAKLQQLDIDAYAVVISENGIQGAPKGFLKNVDTLVIMIPPGLRRNTGADYVLKMSHFLTEIRASKVPQVIFISSTSVYGDEQQLVTEKDVPKPTTEAGRQLFQVEQLFFNSSDFKTTILRFGGLVGESRQPVKYLAGRKDLSSANDPVNLIHRDDCISIITEIIKQEAYGHIINGVHPSHPTKEDYYRSKAEELQLVPPHFAAPIEKAGKQVDSENLSTILEYTFKTKP
ncbi:SDR family NAD(P)-dependent oxidoreductase [Patiriisocius marinus]|uniref:Epimerase n=1 Tax=Patiriisocius marinus TaxID=1397112 RepID=A0A5J4IWR8_9FLAO|nr:SDR family NAD(P)-dependent oxidoreductase [Patiriisocius marinus]GER58802.1 epimerase [Patiriisocius marinus]